MNKKLEKCLDVSWLILIILLIILVLLVEMRILSDLSGLL
jgi:hypothetical protein